MNSPSSSAILNCYFLHFRLFESPRKPSPKQKTLTPEKWIREEFEKPSPEVESAKRSLINKLEECAYRGRYCRLFQFHFEDTLSFDLILLEIFST